MNFLSVTFDDLNAFSFLKTLYGGTLHTPNIDRVMAMGTTFENAFAQVAICNASRASALTGLNPGLTGVHMNHEDVFRQVDPGATFPGILNAAGYRSSIIGKVFHHALSDDVALILADYAFRAPGGSFENTPFLDPGPSTRPIEADGDHINVSAAIDVLNGAGTDPFSLFLGISKPHVGWVVPQNYYDLYPPEDIVLPFRVGGDLSDIPPFMRDLVDDTHQAVTDAGVWQKLLQAYFASITYADAQLGRVLDTLEANGQLDTTAILLWTDHGYHLGDKDSWHKFTLWEEAARAPFVLALPGSEDNGQRVSQPVELVDMMPTVLDYLGIDPPAGLSGRSLRPFVENPALTDDGVAITTMYGSAAIRTDQYRFIRYEDGSAELYDLAADPNQWTNLADDANFGDVRTSLETRLRSELAADGWSWAGESGASGGDGADLIVVAPGSGPARGGVGDDTYFVQSEDAALVEAEGGGDDTVYALGAFTLPDHVEDLHSQLRAGPAHLVGNEGANLIMGWNHLEGLGGDDELTLTSPGLADGGAGDDRVSGYNGYRFNDVLYGGSGNDILRGWTADDRLDGGIGNDVIDGSSGIDTVSYLTADAGIRIDLRLTGAQDTGGAGIDRVLSVENAVGSARNDTLIGSVFANTLNGVSGNDIIQGFSSNDVLIGGTGSDRLYGGAGNDRLQGVQGSDLIRGDTGNDLLIGSGGRDRLEGGLDRDVFQFGRADSAVDRSLADTIVDFARDEADRIDLRLIDAVEGTPTNDAFTFIGSAAFSGKAGEARYEEVGSVLFVEGDTNGDGLVDFTIRVEGVASFEATDFLL